MKKNAIGLHRAAPHGILSRYWRRYPSGSRVIESACSPKFGSWAAEKSRWVSKCFCLSAGEPQRVLHAMAAMLPGKGEHESGDTASNALAPAWPSMCARQAQIMAPGRFCYLPRPNTRPTRKGRAGQTPQNPARCNSGGRAGASPVCPSVRAHARGTVRVSVCGHASQSANFLICRDFWRSATRRGMTWRGEV